MPKGNTGRQGGDLVSQQSLPLPQGRLMANQLRDSAMSVTGVNLDAARPRFSAAAPGAVAQPVQQTRRVVVPRPRSQDRARGGVMGDGMDGLVWFNRVNDHKQNTDT